MQTVLKAIQKMNSDEERKDFLAKNYPTISVYLMKKRDLKEELDKFMEECNECTDWRVYS